MAKVRVYHNPRCGKSREVVKILNERSIGYEVIEYLKEPPTVKELAELVKKLGIKPFELIRKGETIFKEQYRSQQFSDEEWIRIMVEHPILIERPIVIKNNKAVIGRPPEKVLEIL